MIGFYRKLLILLTLYVSYGYIYHLKFLRKKIAIYLISPHEFIIFAVNSVEKYRNLAK